MLGRFLSALRKPAPAAAPAASPAAARVQQVLAAHAAFERHYAEWHGPAQAPDATVATLQAYAHACYELDTPAHDAECELALLRILALEPDNPQAHYALALQISADARFAEAEAHLRAAYARAPDDINVRYALAMCLLGRSDYPEGYRLFGVRLAGPSHPAPHIAALPAWQGEPLAGKRIVLRTDWGGFGDDIAYLRYARAIREAHRPARLLVAARAPMLRLLAAQPYIDEAIGLDAQPAADFQCSLIDAVSVMQSDVATLPSWPSYVEPPAAELAYWQRRFENERRLKVGLVWTSTSVPQIGSDAVGRYDKHLPNRALAALAGIGNMVFVSLQKGAGIPRAADLLPGAAVIDETETLSDFADTAALMRQLDLVVAMDTGVGHLAGALGVPTLLFLKKSRGYFWPENGVTTPWYPSMRMVVQESLRDWSPVLGRLRATLERRAAGTPWPQCFDAG